MDHRLYKDWLLNDERLPPDQDRDLRIHLRSCPECNALAQANLSLRSATVINPVNGFVLRFQVRLAAQRKLQRRQTLIGLSLLAVVGLGGIFWLLAPYLPYLALPPAQLAGLWISNMVYLALAARVMSALGNTLLSVLGSLIPIYAWALALVILGGIGFFWTKSVHRMGKITQSAV